MLEETLIPIAEAARLVPGRPHLATLHRWIARGCRGIRLESILVGGRRFTSREAIARFIQGTSAQRDSTSALSTPSAASADAALDELGF
jgi:hypothetical protein